MTPSVINKLLDNQGNSIRNSQKTSENFNDYFCKIASDLKKSSSSLPLHRTGIGTYSDFMKNSVTNTIHPNDADAGEVYSIFKNFKNKSTRDTKISALKIANESYVFTNALAGVINKSLKLLESHRSIKKVRKQMSVYIRKLYMCD